LHKFPANRENNREFSAIATLLALRLKEHQELESAETPCGANELGSGVPAGEAKGRGQGAAKRR
jgi:hypothetical protein